jgi:hypothetical protein
MSGDTRAQKPARIEQLDPALEEIVSPSEPIQDLADGFGGAQGPAEGPVWWTEGGYLLFSDIHNDRRMKYQPGTGVSLFQEPTNRANGLTRDLQGRLLACEHDSRRVTRQELDGSLTVVANSFQGRQLNRPNDVVVKSDGCIYFTDPWTSLTAPEQWDLSFSGVYRVTPDLGTMTLLIGKIRNQLLAKTPPQASHQRRCSPRTITCAGAIAAWSAAVNYLASARRTPRSAKPAPASRSGRPPLLSSSQAPVP